MTAHYAATTAMQNPNIEPDKSCRRSPAASLPNHGTLLVPDAVAKKIIPLLDSLRDQRDVEGSFERVIRNLYKSNDPVSDEAMVVLMCFYVGESQEEIDLVLARGKRMVPLLRKYMYTTPGFRNRHYPDSMLKPFVDKTESFQGTYDGIKTGERSTADDP
jgi:hypothetical protein